MDETWKRPPKSDEGEIRNNSTTEFTSRCKDELLDLPLNQRKRRKKDALW